jgi:hypothetical protein
MHFETSGPSREGDEVRRFRGILTTFLGLLLLLDSVTAFKFWSNGPPTRMSLIDKGGGVMEVFVEPVPFGRFDWIILLALIGVHAVLSYLVWTAWRGSNVRMRRITG